MARGTGICRTPVDRGSSSRVVGAVEGWSARALGIGWGSGRILQILHLKSGIAKFCVKQIRHITATCYSSQMFVKLGNIVSYQCFLMLLSEGKPGNIAEEKPWSGQAGIRMRSHCLPRLDDDNSAPSFGI